MGTAPDQRRDNTRAAPGVGLLVPGGAYDAVPSPGLWLWPGSAPAPEGGWLAAGAARALVRRWSGALPMWLGRRSAGEPIAAGPAGAPVGRRALG
jgi:hypothetical protein